MTPPSRPEDRPTPGDASGSSTAPENSTSLATPPTLPPSVADPRPREEGPDLAGPFGRYTILRRLGKGGMGRVYLAHDTQLDRQVALKVPQLGLGDPDTLRERFYREARAAATLHHPNICPVYDVGAVGETPYLTMAYIEGRPLHEWAAASGAPCPVGEALALVRKVALALDEAHRKGVVHRDLKPSNVMLDQRGEPVVMDFGLARRLHLADEARLTSPGLIVGTPAYLPPEAVLSQAEARPAGDVYSLGVMLYELLVGRCPYVGPAAAVLGRIATEPVEPPSRHRPDLGSRLDGLCLRALARAPEDRFASMADFAAAIAAFLSEESATAVDRPAAATAPVRRRAATTAGQVDERAAARVLELLRRLGWARAVQKLRHKAQREGEATRLWQGFLDWLTGQRTADAQAVDAYEKLPCGRALRGWALVGQASHLLRDRDNAAAQKMLDRAEAQGDPEDGMLRASVAHVRAASLIHVGRSDQALPLLHEALAGFGREHFMTGRVLDTLGMAYACKGNFPVAREFYEQSIRHKRRADDEAGVAVSHGQLGRLYLDWGHLDEAEHHFQEDLRLAQRLRSTWSEAQIYNHLGQVALARGEREARAGRRSAARRQWGVAAGWLDESIRHSQDNRHAVAEGFARKDRALVYLHEGDLDRAEEQVRLAAGIFAANQFAEGAAKVHQVDGMVLRGRERFAEAERRFRLALEHFEAAQEVDEVVACHWEIARTLRDGGAPTPLVTRAFGEALRRAEEARLDPLVRDIELEFHEADVEAYQRHLYQRARGFGVEEDSPSLMEGTSESATVLFIDLPGFAEVSHGLDPEAVLVTFNHLMADFSDVLARHQGRVIAYRGNGLMALVRDARHAERGVQAALDLVLALEEFNRPRELLALPCFHVRIGLASGDLLLGNVGTYRKMDFTAIGATVNLAGALRNEAEPGVPCVSRGTYEVVRERFRYRSAAPRSVSVAGFGPVEVWDVIGRNEAPRR
jgi:class 3 adenylate cyclase/predicted Ser/Thr protein kinase/Tfp pilus assembly protein PilF